MNINEILQSITEFSHSPIGWAVALMLTVIAAGVMRWLHLSVNDLAELKKSVDVILKDPFLTANETATAATNTRKKAADIAKYLDVAATGSKTQKILATAKILLK